MQRSIGWIIAGVFAIAVVPAVPATGQVPAGKLPPGQQGSGNVKIMAHLPLGGPFNANDIEIEQELARPYVYVSGRSTLGFYIISVKDPSDARLLHTWTIENPGLHQGGARDNKYFKLRGRYYTAQSFEFQAQGPDNDLGAVVFDVTGLPDPARVREVNRIRAADAPGGFHNIFAYKHSSGASLLFSTVSAPHAKVYDLARVVAGGAPAPIATIPNPTPDARRGYHDFYVGFHPESQQDRFYGAGQGGYFVYDITNVQQPRLLTSVAARGMEGGHTFTPDPTGRYAVAETEYQYAPLRIFDLAPGLTGDTRVVSRPVGAWTARWDGLAHNTEVRWPYVFVSAYEDGMQVFNMMDPSNPYTVGFYDTYDGPNQINKANPFEPRAAPGAGDVTNGSFGIDVRNADGLIVTADMYTGFWAFKLEGFDGWNGHQWGLPNVSSAQDWDNGPDGARRPVS